MKDEERFVTLWNDYLEGELDESRLAELRRLMEDDPSITRLAADSFQTHRLLGLAAQESSKSQEDFVRDTLTRLPASREQFVERVMQPTAKASGSAVKLNARGDSKTGRASPGRKRPSHTYLEREQRMNRLVSASCLSMSVLAIVLAVYLSPGKQAAVGDSSSADFDRIVSSIDALSQRIDRIEAAPLGAGAGASRVGSSGAGTKGSVEGSPASSDTLAALEARLASLESAENIARLANSGRKQIRVEEAREVLAHLTESNLSSEEKAERLEAHWRKHGHVRGFLHSRGLEDEEAVLPLLALSQDQGLNDEMRLRVLSEISDSRISAVRAPLLDLLYSDESPRLRQQAVRNLASHGSDVDIQNAILAVSRDDESEEVRGTAERRLARLYREAKESTPGSPITQLDPSEFPENNSFQFTRVLQLGADGAIGLEASSDGADLRATGVRIESWTGDGGVEEMRNLELERALEEASLREAEARQDAERAKLEAEKYRIESDK